MEQDGFTSDNSISIIPVHADNCSYHLLLTPLHFSQSYHKRPNLAITYKEHYMEYNKHKAIRAEPARRM